MLPPCSALILLILGTVLINPEIDRKISSQQGTPLYYHLDFVKVTKVETQTQRLEENQMQSTGLLIKLCY